MPDDNGIDLPSPGGPHERFPLVTLAHARPDLLDHQDNGPMPLLRVRRHGLPLECERLLFMRGDAGIEPQFHGSGLSGQKPSTNEPSKMLISQGCCTALRSGTKL